MSAELFIESRIDDPKILEAYRSVLDDWSSQIVFSPIAKLGSETEFVVAIRHPIYLVSVTTQIERRRLEHHEAPYRDDDLPGAREFKRDVDPDHVTFTPIADFQKHHRSVDVFETRQKYRCTQCDGEGKETCDDCSGNGQVDCSHCDGYGSVECSECDGAGHIEKTRTKQRRVDCSTCDATGRSGPDFRGRRDRCIWCKGRGWILEDYEESYQVRCGNCAASGKVTCDNCRGRGLVTCSNCDGRGEITCRKCDGRKRLLAWTSVETDEEPLTEARQWTSPALPAFRKKENPLSTLSKTLVFEQDERRRIGEFEFAGHPAATVLSHEAELCREKHTGRVLRQRLEISASYVIEYQYRYEGANHSIFLNLESRLVEDCGGPVQQFIENIDRRADQQLTAGNFEDSYRLVTRALCMDESTPAEQSIRDRALAGLARSYRAWAWLTWFLGAACWFLLFPHPDAERRWTVLLGAPVLLLALEMFWIDWGVRLSGPSQRRQAAGLLALIALFSGASVGLGQSWTNLIAWGATLGVFCCIAASRSNLRAIRRALETQMDKFEDLTALKQYVLGLDPRIAGWRTLKRWGTVWLVSMIIATTATVIVEANRRATLRFTLVVEGGHPGEKAEASLTWRGESVPIVVSNDRPHSAELPARSLLGGTLSVVAPQHDTIAREIGLIWGKRDLGELKLVRMRGALALRSQVDGAEFEVRREDGSMAVVTDAKNVALPSGVYLVRGRKGLLEQTQRVRIEDRSAAILQFDFPRIPVTFASVPRVSSLTLFRGDQRKPILQSALPLPPVDLSPGKYRAQFSWKGKDVEKSFEVSSEKSLQIETVLPFSDLKLTAPGATSAARFEIRRGATLEQTGVLPAAISDFESGSVQIRFKDRWIEETKQIELKAGSLEHVEFAIARGTLQIATTPTGAEFIVQRHTGDILETGRTPFTAESIPEGEYVVALSYKGTKHEATLHVARNSTSTLDHAFKVGRAVIARGPLNARYSVSGEKLTTEEIRLDQPITLPVGNYLMRAEYNGISVQKTVTVTPAQSTEIDFTENTADLVLRTNQPGARVVLTRNSEPAFALPVLLPTTIEALPFGEYSVSGKDHSSTLRLDRTRQEIGINFSRSIRDVIPREIATRTDSYGTLIYSASASVEFSRIYPHSYDAIWNAAMEQGRVGLLREAPWAHDRAAGWIICKSFEADPSFFDKSISCRFIILLTPAGSDGVEVKVSTHLFKTWSTTTQNEVTRRWETYLHSSPFSDYKLAEKLGRTFLDGIARRLAKS